ncbi:Short-chain dehydrogenase [Candidatus Kryptonium thompsonii]|uniref:Short-chain dehydrogenase n=1 Tax=Candidatus Kryptonium thompsonii TaxID=1633631 RepID=A0A0P1LQA2_9BACT|nr:SDR family oxidoreductase [Candidatus Kryptonium thompsoni]CUS78704.1 Short-chain dehydrogenase [Candidatus Kryptonium thompsoni]CUS83269.1 Short-chain dehydrogenase [Candidatus Kryptonium thompsoni]CUS84166.1 Short-chain dehydrogenase [Candidatus Kryptonium thompsoni]CUS84686.1 Short-chain dehydrogenase [Candidatus Kryptonium thompsoni]CUS87017.1 Short-chain dehydrogenase [Candidatus Kryptonium thompsoni]
MASLSGKTVIITGASSGIGKETAKIFAKAGCKVVLASRNLDNLKKVEEEIRNLNPNVVAIQTDVGDFRSLDNLIEQTLKTFNKIDILINNAGFGIYGWFHMTPFEDIENIMRVNFLGSAYLIHKVLPLMIEQRDGIIVNISSVVGKRGVSGMGIYSASKFALTGLTEALRVEYKKFGIHFIGVHPGTTDTKFFENARYYGTDRMQGKFMIMSAEKVAKEIFKAVVKKKREIVLTPLGKLTVWINKFAPSFVDFMMSKVIKIT